MLPVDSAKTELLLQKAWAKLNFLSLLYFQVQSK